MNSVISIGKKLMGNRSDELIGFGKRYVFTILIIAGLILFSTSLLIEPKIVGLSAMDTSSTGKITDPTEGATIDATYTFRWGAGTSSDSYTWAYNLDGGSWNDVSGNATTDYVVVSNMASGSHTFHLAKKISTIADSLPSSVSSSDTTSASYSETDEVNFTVADEVAINITSPSNGAQFYTSQVTLQWTVHFNSGDTMKTGYKIDSGDWNLVDTETSTGTYNFSENLYLSSGDHTLYVEAEVNDPPSSTTTHVSVHVYTDPYVYITAPRDGYTYEDSTIKTDWYAYAGQNDTITGFDLKLDNQTNVSLSASDRNYTYSGVSDGNHTITIWMHLQNSSDLSDSVTFNINTSSIPTSVSITNPTEGENITSGNITFTWHTSRETVSNFSISLTKPHNTGTDYTYHPDHPDSNFSIPYTFQENGNYTIRILLLDGNNSQDIKNFTVSGAEVIETPIFVYITNTTIIGNIIDLNWDANSTSPIDHYEVRIDGSAWKNIGRNTEYTVKNLTGGKHTFSVKGINMDGNIYICNHYFSIAENKQSSVPISKSSYTVWEAMQITSFGLMGTGSAGYIYRKKHGLF